MNSKQIGLVVNSVREIYASSLYLISESLHESALVLAGHAGKNSLSDPVNGLLDLLESGSASKGHVAGLLSAFLRALADELDGSCPTRGEPSSSVS